MFVNRKRRKTLSDKALKLISIYSDNVANPGKYKPPPSTGDKKKLAVEACRVDSDEWKWFNGQTNAAHTLNVSSASISMCCTGKRYSAKGWMFRFADAKMHPPQNVKRPLSRKDAAILEHKTRKKRQKTLNPSHTDTSHQTFTCG